jgi:hypothetical protein
VYGVIACLEESRRVEIALSACVLLAVARCGWVVRVGFCGTCGNQSWMVHDRVKSHVTVNTSCAAQSCGLCDDETS